MIVSIIESQTYATKDIFSYNKSVLNIHRDLYRNLQFHPVAGAENFNDSAFAYFGEEMQKIQDNLSPSTAAIALDEFLGSLGVTEIYPHRDNTFTGVI